MTARTQGRPRQTEAGVTAVSPYGGRLTSLGRSRISANAITAASARRAQTKTSATRQPKRSVSSAISGKNTSCPVAELAESSPTTRPRRWVNQRVATVAASTMAVRPEPTPTTTPHNSTSCHTCVIASETMRPPTISAAAETMTRRSPKRFINAAANGPNRPKSRRRIANAVEICAFAQPNSCSNGTISTPGAPIAPAVTSMVRKVTPTTTQP